MRMRTAITADMALALPVTCRTQMPRATVWKPSPRTEMALPRRMNWKVRLRLSSGSAGAAWGASLVDIGTPLMAGASGERP